jgi:TetR/AcrR family transcriptional repressor of nem operon
MARDTRERILQAATEIFQTKGYHGCGINEILSAAEVPKGSFYHFFASKEALAEAVLDAYVSCFEGWLEEQCAAASSPLQALEATLGGARDMLRDKQFTGGCMLGSLAQELAGSDTPVVHSMRAMFPRWEAQFSRCLEAAKRAGELPRTADPVELAAYILDGWEGAVLRAKLEKSAEPLDRFIAHTIRYLKML